MADLMAFDGASFKGIIFDLDGTLYRMRWFFRPIMTYKVFPNCLRLPRFLKIRGMFSGTEMRSEENLMKAVCDRVASVENCTTDAIRKWISDSFYPSFVSSMKYFKNSRPQINLTLSDVKRKGYKLAVLSDYAKVEERLRTLNIDYSLFDTLTSSESIGALKPAARPFLEIADLWNFAPENILVIGDRDDTDGQAARNAQMQFLQIIDSNDTSDNKLQWIQLSQKLQSLVSLQ